MSRIVEELVKKTEKRSATQTALRMLSRGKLTIEEIAEDSGLTVEEVKTLAAQKTA